MVQRALEAMMRERRAKADRQRADPKWRTVVSRAEEVPAVAAQVARQVPAVPWVPAAPWVPAVPWARGARRPVAQAERAAAAVARAAARNAKRRTTA